MVAPGMTLADAAAETWRLALGQTCLRSCCRPAASASEGAATMSGQGNPNANMAEPHLDEADVDDEPDVFDNLPG